MTTWSTTEQTVTWTSTAGTTWQVVRGSTGGGGGGGGGVPTSRTLTAGTGLSGGGDLTADRTFDVDYGSTAGTAAEGNDARLSDARTPTAHAASHENGGSDEVALDGSQITTGTVGTARLGSGTASASTYLRGDQTWSTVTPGASALNDLTDVDTATDPPATDDVLAWDGTVWTPAALTAADTGAIPASIIDAKGDLVVGTAADTAARLGVGTNGQVLTADSSEAGGMKWAAAAGGGSSWSPPSNAWVPLAASYAGSNGGGGGTGANASQSNGLAILQWCDLPAAIDINAVRVFLNAANGGASARAGLSLWLPDGPNGGPGTGISAPSANLAINGATGEKEVTWATPVTLPAGGFWFAWTPYGLDTGGTNPNFWAYPRGNDHLWVTGSAPSGNTRRPQMIVTGLSDYTPPTNPTVSSQHVLGSTVDATAVMVRIA